MNKYLLLLLTLVVSVNARENQQWITMTPMPSCAEFKTQYAHTSAGYQLRYQQKDSEEYTYFKKKLENINNLSDLTDELVVASSEYCPLTINLSQSENGACEDFSVDTNPWSDQYSNLIEQIVSHVDQTQANCKDVIPYIELQNKISSLKGKELLNFRSKFSLLKPFTGAENDKMIDHYNECGGKSGTKQFLTNMILLESQKACVFPSPPGMLSFEDAKKVAEQVASSYPNMGIIKISGVKDDMGKKVALGMMKQVLKNSTADLFGANFKLDMFIEDLPSVKKMNSLPASLAMDYASHVAAPNLPLEVIDLGFKYIMRENLGSMLEDMPQPERNDFLDFKITPKAKATYDACIAQTKEKLLFGQTNQSPQNMINYGKKLKENYCAKNPEACETDVNSCAKGKVNYTTMRSDIDDQAIIQACMLKSITESIPVLLEGILKGQQTSFEKYFNLSDEMVKDIANKSYQKLFACADKKVKASTKISQKETFTKNIEPLYHLSTDNFKEALTECSTDIENSLVNDFVTLVMASTPAILDVYGTGEKTDLHGINIDVGAKKFASDVIASTVPLCVSKQLLAMEKNPELKISAINCRPMIESEATKRVVAQTLNSTFKDYGLESTPQVKLLLKEFDNCSDQSIKSGHNALFNPDHQTPIMDSKEAETYLARNNELYNCIQNVIVQTGDIVAGQTIQTMADDQKDPADKIYIQNIKPEVQQIVKACFEDTLKTLKSMEDFMQFNNSDGLAELQKDCSDKATMYALPKVVNRTLINTFKENGLEQSQDAKLLLTQFKECTDENSDPRKQKQFTKCVTNTITQTAVLVTNQTVKGLKDSYANSPELVTKFTSIEQSAQDTAQRCFESKFNEIDDLDNFLKINDNGELEKLQADCTDKITNYVLPNVMPIILDSTFDEYGIKDNHGPKMVKLKFTLCSMKESEPLINCVKDAIAASSGEVVDITLTDMLKNNSDSITDVKFFNQLKPKVIKRTEDCFKNGLKNLKSTDEFLEFNDSEGVTKLTDACTKDTTEYALSEILTVETLKKVSGMADSNLVQSTDKVLALSASNMQKDFNIKIPSNFKGDRFKETVKRAFRTFYDKDPDTATDKFIEYYTKKVQVSTLDNIQSNIKSKVQKLSKPSGKFDDFFKVMHAECLDSFYELNKKHIEKFTENQDSSSPNKDIPDLIAKALYNGLNYAQSEGRYNTFLQKIKEICKDPKKFNRIDTFFEVKEFKYLYNPIIADLFKDKMNTTAVTQCQETIKENNIKLSSAHLKLACEPTVSSDARIDYLKRAHSTKDAILLEFAIKRKNKFLELNESDITADGKFINDLVTFVQTDKKVRALVNPALSGSEKETNQLLALVTDQVFADKSAGSFTDKFSQLQLIGAIGLSYEDAKEKVAAEMKAKGSVVNWALGDNAQESLAKRWSYEGIEKLLDWKSLKGQDREETVNEVYENAIKPMTVTTDKMSSVELKKYEKETEDKLEKVKKHVLDLISDSKTHRETVREGMPWNRRDVKIYRSFVEQLAEDIDRDINPFRFD